jgi:hypothetical protein
MRTSYLRKTVVTDRDVRPTLDRERKWAFAESSGRIVRGRPHGPRP